MNKPNDYDEVQVGDYTPIALGGHHIIIKNVKEDVSSKGNKMLVIAFDFAKSDSQPEYFMQMFTADIRPDKKWPNAGTSYILTEDKDGKTSRKFKSFITAFERSNNCEAVWGDNFCSQFKNRIIGGVFGEIENEYNGKRSMQHRLRWFCDNSKVDSASVPDPVYLQGSQPSSSSDGFITGSTVEDVPF